MAVLGLSKRAVYELTLPELSAALEYKTRLVNELPMTIYKSMRLQTAILFNLQVKKKDQVKRPEDLIKFSFESSGTPRPRPTRDKIVDIFRKIDEAKNNN